VSDDTKLLWDMLSRYWPFALVLSEAMLLSAAAWWKGTKSEAARLPR
jgi:hypothetical protein